MTLRDGSWGAVRSSVTGEIDAYLRSLKRLSAFRTSSRGIEPEAFSEIIHGFLDWAAAVDGEQG